MPIRSIARGVALLAALACMSSAACAKVTISNKRTKNFECSVGACVPTGPNANLKAADLADMLAASDIKVFTGNGALSIALEATVSWVSASRLTLESYQSINIQAPVVVAGPGSLTLTTNVAGQGGTLNLAPGARIDFWDAGSDLIIDGADFTLAPDIHSLADGIAANPSGHFALAKDYDAFADGIYLHAPIPVTFAGTFHGLGHTIDRLSINETQINTDVGLFKRIDTGGRMSYIALTNFNIRGSNGNLGGLAGLNIGTMSYVMASGTGFLSGLVAGSNAGLIEHSQAAATGAQTEGILTGDNGAGAVIEDCHTSGSIVGNGGLAGVNYGLIIDSSSSATVSVSSDHGQTVAGGLVAFNTAGGRIERSFATGTVRGPQTSKSLSKKYGPVWGGLVGWLEGSIVDSYATGTVTLSGVDQTNAQVGGLVGFMENASTIERSYSAGIVDAAHKYVGGLLGFDGEVEGNTIDSAYWDLDTSGIDDRGRGAGNIVFLRGIKGLKNSKFKAGLPSGFSPAVWAQSSDINGGYPYLRANPPQ